MSTGSASQPELAAAFSALVMGVGSEAVLVLAWSDLLDFFADGASDVFVAVRFLVAAAGC